jgi:chlorobactene glucosyltransferase
LIAALLFAALGLGLALHLARLRGGAPALPPPATELPSTTIVLPVRNEEENLLDCLASLRAQGGEPAIRIVDDGSTDATPHLLAGLAGEPRLSVLPARPLPPGWSGKVNALATAFAEVDTDWVLFTDADTRHAPELLARAHAALGAHRLDALSLAGLEEARGAGENLITPPVYALLDLLLGDWAPHARGDGRPPVANGQYFLVRAAALRAIGGLDAIAGRLLDDVALAQALAGAGFRVGFRRAGPHLRVRMYRGGRASAAGWRRNLALIFAGSLAIPAGVVLTALATTAAWLLAALDPSRAIALAVAWGGAVASSAWIRKSAGNDPRWAWLAPFDLFALAGLLAIAARDARRGRVAAWRGREGRI